MKASFLTGTFSAKCEEYTSLFNHLPKVNHHLPKLINCWSSALVPVQIMSYQPEFSHPTHHLPRFNHCLPKNSHWQLKNTNFTCTITQQIQTFLNLTHSCPIQTLIYQKLSLTSPSLTLIYSKQLSAQINMHCQNLLSQNLVQ